MHSLEGSEVADQNAEFIVACSGDSVRVANCPGNALRECAKYFVTEIMPVCVVDVLELVDVEIQGLSCFRSVWRSGFLVQRADRTGVGCIARPDDPL